MPLIRPSITDGTAPLVPHDPLPLWRVTNEEVTLGLPGLGAVTVDVDGITTNAPDDLLRQQTWSRLGLWATGQWYALHGYLVLPGATVARDTEATAIVGASRAGSSVTAVQLTRHGYSIVSDGFTIITGEGIAVSHTPHAAIDSFVAENLFPDMPNTARASGAQRTNIIAPGHGDAPLRSFVLLREKAGLEHIQVHQINDWTAAIFRNRIVSPVLQAPTPPTSLLARMADLPAWRVTRSYPESMDDAKHFAPPALALRIDQVLRGGE
jgi:hypothetical protein